MKKRLFSFCVSICLVGSLVACEDLPGTDSKSEPVATEEFVEAEADAVETSDLLQMNLTKKYLCASGNQEENIVSSETSTMVPELTGEYAEKYPGLKAALAETFGDADGELNDNLYELTRAAKEYFTDGAPFDDVSLYDNTERKILRADKTCVSIYSSWVGYTGGAHGMYAKTGYNFDTEEGRLLDFSDVITDEDKFFEIVDMRLKEWYGEDEYNEYKSMDEYRNEMAEEGIPYDWTLEYDGVTIYFPPYTLAAYAYGEQRVKVYFDDADIFNEKYTKAPDSYIFPIKEDNDNYEFIDVDGDGAREEIGVFTDQATEDSEELSYKLEFNGGEYILGEYITKQDTYIVNDSGKFSLIFIQSDYTDDSSINFFDLDSCEKIENTIWTIPSDFEYEYKDIEREDGLSSYSQSETFAALTDPHRMDLSMEVYALGNYFVRDDFTLVNEDGRIKDVKPLNDSYEPIYPRILKTRKDLDCDIVDENGEVTEKSVIPENLCVMIYKTDGKNFVDLTEVDEAEVKSEGDEDFVYLYTDNENIKPKNPGVIYRIYFDKDSEEYTKQINGEPEDEAFYGVLYAG